MEIKIKLKIKEGVEIELSENDCKLLYDLLDKIYGKKFEINYPIVIEKWIKEYPQYPSYPIITCDVNTSENSLGSLSIDFSKSYI